MAETVPDFRRSTEIDELAIVEIEELERTYELPSFNRGMGYTAFELLATESSQSGPDVDGYTMLKSTPQEGKPAKTDEDDY